MLVWGYVSDTNPGVVDPLLLAEPKNHAGNERDGDYGFSDEERSKVDQRTDRQRRFSIHAKGCQRRAAVRTDTFTITVDNGVRTVTRTVTVPVDGGPLAGTPSVGVSELSPGPASDYRQINTRDSLSIRDGGINYYRELLAQESVMKAPAFSQARTRSMRRLEPPTARGELIGAKGV